MQHCINILNERLGPEIISDDEDICDDVEQSNERRDEQQIEGECNTNNVGIDRRGLDNAVDMSICAEIGINLALNSGENNPNDTSITTYVHVGTNQVEAHDNEKHIQEDFNTNVSVDNYFGQNDVNLVANDGKTISSETISLAANYDKMGANLELECEHDINTEKDCNDNVNNNCNQNEGEQKKIGNGGNNITQINALCADVEKNIGLERHNEDCCIITDCDDNNLYRNGGASKPNNDATSVTTNVQVETNQETEYDIGYDNEPHLEEEYNSNDDYLVANDGENIPSDGASLPPNYNQMDASLEQDCVHDIENDCSDTVDNNCGRNGGEQSNIGDGISLNIVLNHGTNNDSRNDASLAAAHVDKNSGLEGHNGGGNMIADCDDNNLVEYSDSNEPKNDATTVTTYVQEGEHDIGHENQQYIDKYYNSNDNVDNCHQIDENSSLTLNDREHISSNGTTLVANYEHVQNDGVAKCTKNKNASLLINIQQNSLIGNFAQDKAQSIQGKYYY